MPRNGNHKWENEASAPRAQSGAVTRLELPADHAASAASNVERHVVNACIEEELVIHLREAQTHFPANVSAGIGRDCQVPGDSGVARVGLINVQEDVSGGDRKSVGLYARCCHQVGPELLVRENIWGQGERTGEDPCLVVEV